MSGAPHSVPMLQVVPMFTRKDQGVPLHRFLSQDVWVWDPPTGKTSEKPAFRKDKMTVTSRVATRLCEGPGSRLCSDEGAPGPGCRAAALPRGPPGTCPTQPAELSWAQWVALSLLTPAGPILASSAPSTEGPKGIGPLHTPGLHASSSDGPAVRLCHSPETEVQVSSLFLCSNSALNKGLRAEDR